MVQHWTGKKSTAGLIGQSPSLWMVTRAVRLQAFHEQILGKFEAFLRTPLRLFSTLGWLNLEYLLPSLSFVARFFSDSDRASKLAGSGNAAAFARPPQESYKNLLQHIWVLHQQASMQAFPLVTPALGVIQTVSRTSFQNPVPLPASKRNVQNAESLPLWPSSTVYEDNRHGETQSAFQQPTLPSQVLKSPRLASALMTGDVLKKKESATILQSDNWRASSAAEPTYSSLPLVTTAIKALKYENPIPTEVPIFPKLEFSGVHQPMSIKPLAGTQQEDRRRQLRTDEQELQYAQLAASTTAVVEHALQSGNKFVSSQSEQFTAPSKPPVSPRLSNLELNRMADQVYRLIARKMQIENERQGKWY